MSSAHRLIAVGSSRISFAAIERFMGGDEGAHTAALPSEQVLRWVAGVVGGMRVVSVENPSRSTHRPSGTFRLRVEGTSTGATDLILRISVPRCAHGWDVKEGEILPKSKAGVRLIPVPATLAAILVGHAERSGGSGPDL